VKAQLFDFCFLPLKIIYAKSKKQCAVWAGKNHTKSMTEKNGGNTTGGVFAVAMCGRNCLVLK